MMEVKKLPKNVQKELKGIDKQLLALRNHRNELVAPYERSELDAYVGRYFRFHNSYGGGSGHKPWYGYVKVLANDEDSGLRCLRFEQRGKGEILLYAQDFHVIQTVAGYEEITRAAFTNAWYRLTEEMERVWSEASKHGAHGGT